MRHYKAAYKPIDFGTKFLLAGESDKPTNGGKNAANKF